MKCRAHPIKLSPMPLRNTTTRWGSVAQLLHWTIVVLIIVQYTLATDRGNVNLANRFTALHPAVLRLIKRIVDVGDAQGIDVAVCGEMASQPLMAFALIGLGVRELSVNPRSVSATKRLVRGISTALAMEAASAALAARTAADAERELRFRLVAALGNGALPAEGN